MKKYENVYVNTSEEFVSLIEQGYDFGYLYLPNAERSKLRLLALERYEDEPTAVNKYLLARTIFTFESSNDRYALARKLLLSAATDGYNPALYDVSSYYLSGSYGFEEDSKQSFIYLKKAADDNYLPAVYELAQFYFDGDVVDKSVNLALDLIRKAADLGYPPALGTLGEMYETGDYFTPDMSTAIDYYRLAALQNDGPSLFSLGRIYCSGDGVAVDVVRGAEYLEKAWEKDYIAAYPYLGILYIEGEGVIKNVKKGLKMIRDAAEAEDPTSHAILGDFYFHGVNVSIDLKKAFSYYKRGSQLNDYYCTYQAGILSFNGQGTEKNSHRAFEYFLKASLGNYYPAFLNLGNCYMVGEGTEVDYKEGFKCFVKARENKIFGASFMIAESYRMGLGVRKNNKLMIKAYEESVAENDCDGLFYYGQMLYKGVFGEIKNEAARDQKRGLELIKRAVDGGNAGAQFWFALYCREQKNYREYLNYTEQAAAFGFPDAFTELGSIYREGKIATQDLKRAFAYFLRGEKLGSQSSIYFAGLCCEKGSGTAPDCDQAFQHYALLDGSFGNQEKLRLIALKLSDFRNFPAPNYQKSLELLHSVARSGLAKAYVDLGNFYRDGRGVPKDLHRAEKYYLRAAQKHVEAAFPAFVTLFEMPSKRKYALKICTRNLIISAAEKGSLAACYGAGILYLSGALGKKDDAKAEFYLESAALNGYPDAYYYLSKLRENRDRRLELLQKGKKQNSSLCVVEIADILFAAGDVDKSNGILLSSLKTCPRGAILLAQHYLDAKLESRHLGLVMAYLGKMRKDSEAIFYSALLAYYGQRDRSKALELAQQGLLMGDISCGFFCGLLTVLISAQQNLDDESKIKAAFRLLSKNYTKKYPLKAHIFIYGLIKLYLGRRVSKDPLILKSGCSSKEARKFLKIAENYRTKLQPYSADMIDEMKIASEIKTIIDILIPYLEKIAVVGSVKNPKDEVAVC